MRRRKTGARESFVEDNLNYHHRQIALVASYPTGESCMTSAVIVAQAPSLREFVSTFKFNDHKLC